MATDFYLTLPSNASMKMYPNNTLAHYITDLPQRIELSGDWECGLAEIQYPHTWYNIGVKDTWFFLNEMNPMGLSPNANISAGYYKTPMTLMNHVNKGLVRMSTDKVRAKMSYSAITQKMTLYMTLGTEFSVPERSALARMLGIDASTISSPPVLPTQPPPSAEAPLPPALLAAMSNAGERAYVHPSLRGRNIALTTSVTVVAPPKETVDGPYSYCKEADNVVDMDQGFDTIYFYTDVVESRIVGDSLAPLLRSLPVGGSHGATVYDRFTNIHYVPLLYAHFKSIEINIRDDNFQMHGFRIRFTSTLLPKSTFTHDASLLNWGCETSSKAQAVKAVCFDNRTSKPFGGLVNVSLY